MSFLAGFVLRPDNFEVLNLLRSRVDAMEKIPVMKWHGCFNIVSVVISVFIVLIKFSSSVTIVAKNDF